MKVSDSGEAADVHDGFLSLPLPDGSGVEGGQLRFPYRHQGKG